MARRIRWPPEQRPWAATGWPLEVIDLDAEPPLPELAQALELAAAAGSRLARQAVAAAEEGRQAARNTRIFVRGSVGHTDGENVIGGWQEGQGCTWNAALRRRWPRWRCNRPIEAAVADAQTILGLSLR